MLLYLAISSSNASSGGSSPSSPLSSMKSCSARCMSSFHRYAYLSCESLNARARRLVLQRCSGSATPRPGCDNPPRAPARSRPRRCPASSSASRSPGTPRPRRRGGRARPARRRVRRPRSRATTARRGFRRSSDTSTSGAVSSAAILAGSICVSRYVVDARMASLKPCVTMSLKYSTYVLHAADERGTSTILLELLRSLAMATDASRFSCSAPPRRPLKVAKLRNLIMSCPPCAGSSGSPPTPSTAPASSPRCP